MNDEKRDEPPAAGGSAPASDSKPVTAAPAPTDNAATAPVTAAATATAPAPATDPAPAPAAVPASATVPAPATDTAKPPAHLASPAKVGAPGLDWADMVPESLVPGTVMMAVLWLLIAEIWSIRAASEVTSTIKWSSLAIAAGLVVGWRAYALLVNAFRTRLLGVSYVLAGGAAFGVSAYYAFTTQDVHESHKLLLVIRAVTLVFLYPVALGVEAIALGDVPKSHNPMGLPFRPSWFRTLWTLYAREVRSFFTTSVPYIVFFVFMVLNGLLFFMLIKYVTQAGADTQTAPTRHVFSNFFLYLSLWILCPAMTMRLVSEEKRLGTIESLLTAPVTDIQVILSKYFAAFTFFVVMQLPTFVYITILRQHAMEWDWGPIFSSYVGLFLEGGLLLAIGLFWSTVTETQLIAFALAVVTNMVFLFAAVIENYIDSPAIREVCRYVSMMNQYEDLSRGIISTKSLVYFLSGIVLFLFAAVRGLETQKWK